MDGKKLAPEALLEQAQLERAGKHGVGRFDLVENRLVGIKSREIYEAPGAMVLWTALRSLEALVWDRESPQLHPGPLRQVRRAGLQRPLVLPAAEALDDYFTTLLRPATGEVRLAMHKGRVTPPAAAPPTRSTTITGDLREGGRLHPPGRRGVLPHLGAPAAGSRDGAEDDGPQGTEGK